MLSPSPPSEPGLSWPGLPGPSPSSCASQIHPVLRTQSRFTPFLSCGGGPGSRTSEQSSCLCSLLEISLLPVWVFFLLYMGAGMVWPGQLHYVAFFHQVCMLKDSILFISCPFRLAFGSRLISMAECLEFY